MGGGGSRWASDGRACPLLLTAPTHTHPPHALVNAPTPPCSLCSYNLDMNLVGDYWGWFGKRSYHHTGCVSTWYAMREALALVGEQGLDRLWSEHRRLHEALWEGLRGMGLEPFVEKEADRLATVNTIKVPPGVDWAALIKHAMDKYSVEIAGGLGPSAGKVWRVGIMGFNATGAIQGRGVQGWVVFRVVF